MVDKVLVASPRGFCAGVEMAIKALTWMVRIFPAPVYCFHEIVHNASVVSTFEKAGVVFVDSISDVPEGAPLMLSAHGSAPDVVAEAATRGAAVVDAVCPLVTKVHHEVRRRAAEGFDIIYVGHDGHDEAVGTVAEAPEAVSLVDPEQGLGGFRPRDPSRVALVAQTTLGFFEWDAVLKDAQEVYPDLWTARRGDLCYATTNRQEAVMALAGASDVVLVVGSENSSNTQALVRVAEARGAVVYRVDGPAAVERGWLESASIVGVTAGASAPDQSVQAVIDSVGAPQVELLRTSDEDEYFPLPPALRSLLAALQSAVEGGVASRAPGAPGLLEDDTSWDAAQALNLLEA